MSYALFALSLVGLVVLCRTQYVRRHLRWKLHAGVDLVVAFAGNVREIAYWQSPLVVPLHVAAEVFYLIVGLLVWALGPLVLLACYALVALTIWLLVASKSDLQAARRWLRGKNKRQTTVIHGEPSPDVGTQRVCGSVASPLPRVSCGVGVPRPGETKRTRSSPLG